MPLLMPFFDFTFRAKPVGQIASVSAATPLPDFMRALSDLFLQAHVFVHPKDGCGRLGCGFVFHGVNSSQKAKQSQPRPKNPA
jgi:hypothetical protein